MQKVSNTEAFEKEINRWFYSCAWLFLSNTGDMYCCVSFFFTLNLKKVKVWICASPVYRALIQPSLLYPREASIGWALKEVKRKLCLVFCQAFFSPPIHSPFDLFVQALAGVCVEVEGKACSPWVDLSPEVTPVLGCFFVCCSQGIKHTSGTGTHAEGNLHQRFGSQQCQAELSMEDFCLLMQRPQKNFPAHWRGFFFFFSPIFKFFSPHARFH